MGKEKGKKIYTFFVRAKESNQRNPRNTPTKSACLKKALKIQGL
jgi:hypothetical protein